MNYIVFDLEFNHKFNSESNEPLMPFEIIQIGAFKLDNNLNIISRFNTLVKPIAYHIVHPYIEELTGIKTEMLENEREFDKVYSDFIEFIGTDNAVLGIWGVSDIKELLRNVKFHNLDCSVLPNKYIDIQECAGKFFKVTKGARIGLKSVIEAFEIDRKGEFHNALNDAYYTAQVLKKLYNEKIKIKKYDDRKKAVQPNNELKKSVDTNALFSQFEKMYKRQLTPEEKSMIKTAYNMGKTNQFLK